MNKVLWISNWKNASGYSEASRQYLLAMDSVGIDVVPRHINLLSNKTDIPERLIELERKSQLSCNICVQHTLPHLMEYNGRYDKNVALFASETSNFIEASWKNKLNLMDEVWVINNQMVEACKASGVKKPTKIIPHTVNIDKFFKSYSTFNIDTDDFIFYSIGEFNRRKNFSALIKAFHAEFSPNEPVRLLVKTNKPDEFEAFSNSVLQGMKLYKTSKYKKIMLIHGYISEDRLNALHQRCHCYISTSYGEAWCQPALDAYGFGKTPILPANTGHLSYGLPELLIDCQEDIVFGCLDTHEDLMTSRETWWHIDIPKLMKKMRYIYNLWVNNKEEYNKLSNKCQQQVFKFSYQNIGELIKSNL